MPGGTSNESTQTLDQARVDAFVEKALGDLSATTTYLLAMLGDHLDLFKALAAQGPATGPWTGEAVAVGSSFTVGVNSLGSKVPSAHAARHERVAKSSYTWRRGAGMWGSARTARPGRTTRSWARV